MAQQYLQVCVQEASNVYAIATEQHPAHYVEITCEEPGSPVFFTNSAPGANPRWPAEIFTLDLSSDRAVHFRLYKATGVQGKDVLIGKATVLSNMFGGKEWKDIRVEISPSTIVAVTGWLQDVTSPMNPTTESRSPGVPQSRSPTTESHSPTAQESSVKPMVLVFDLNVTSTPFQQIQAVRDGRLKDFQGIRHGAHPCKDLSYIGAGYTPEGWTDGEHFGPVPQISEMKMALSRECKDSLTVFQVQCPGVLRETVTSCLRGFCELVGQQQIPHLPVIAHGIQLGLTFFIAKSGNGSDMILPNPRSSPEPYSYWSLVDHCLDGLQMFLMSHNCWGKSRGPQTLEFSMNTSSLNMSCLRQWFPYAVMGVWPMCHSILF